MTCSHAVCYGELQTSLSMVSNCNKGCRLVMTLSVTKSIGIRYSKRKGFGNSSREFLVQLRGIYWEADDDNFQLGGPSSTWCRNHQLRTDWDNLYWPCSPWGHGVGL